MPQEYISCGPVTSILANVAYALPAVKCTLFAEGSPTITQSNTAAFTASVAVTLTGGMATLAGGFVKSTTTINVRLVRD